MRIDILKTNDALDSNPRTQLHYLRSWENKGGQKTVETDRRSHQVNKSISVKITSWQLNKVTLVIALTSKPSLGGTKIFIAAYKNNDTHVTVTPEKDYLPPESLSSLCVAATEAPKMKRSFS